MAFNNRFGNREPLNKKGRCSCGGESRLIKRRNFSHGRKSGGKSYSVYRCNDCNHEIPLVQKATVRRR